MFNQILFSFIFVAIYMSLVYLYSIKKEDLSIIDIGYGPAFVVAAIAQMTFAKSIGIHFTTVFILITLWAIRLALQIGIRKIGKGEDPRYIDIKKNLGPNWKIQSYYKVFLFQGLIVLIIESPVFIASLSQNKVPGALFYIGIILWIWGFYWETVSDMQKYKFKKEGKKGLIKTGLWKYSRHPNYFGEICMWWAIALIALELAWGWLGLISPIIITTLLITFSGIPLLENKLKGNKEFEDYKKKTSVLIPWFPKKG